MKRHIIDLTDTNPPPAKRQKTTHKYSITVEKDFHIRLQAEEKIATSTYALIYPYINNSHEFTKNFCENNDPISTLLAFGNKLNITFIIYDLKTKLAYHNIKTYPKKEMLIPIKNANYLIYSDGDWYQGFPKKIIPSNRIIGCSYRSFFMGKNPDEEFKLRFEIAILFIKGLAMTSSTWSFDLNPTRQKIDHNSVNNILQSKGYPSIISSSLFNKLETNLSSLIKKINKSKQETNTTNLGLKIEFFTRIKNFPQFDQNIMDLLKIFYLERIKNILDHISYRYPHLQTEAQHLQLRQQTLKKIPELIVLIKEKLPNFTEEIIRFIAPIMKNLYLKNMMSWSDITFFVTTLQENINFDIDIDNDGANNLTILIDELFRHDILNLKMLCRKHISFWSDQQKENLKTLPTELHEQLNNTLQHSGS